MATIYLWYTIIISRYYVYDFSPEGFHGVDGRGEYCCYQPDTLIVIKR